MVKKEKPLVLVADDQDMWRNDIIPKALNHFLTVRILKAKDIESAIAIGQKHDITSADPLKLMIIDMHMPSTDKKIDIDVNAGIKVLNEIQFCPAIIFTAFPSDDNRKKAFNAGAKYYIPKYETINESNSLNIEKLIKSCKALLSIEDK